jgi:hypothetical protein
MNSLYLLLRNAIDYAGLFPPAKLGMHAAVESYAAYIASEHSWMLGRFIVPLSRLGEFERASRHTLPGEGRTPWHLSVLGGTNARDDLAAIHTFNAEHADSSPAGHAIIDTIEIKASTPEEVCAFADAPHSLSLYFEIPIDSDPAPLIGSIAKAGARAKIRTGGTSEESIPRASDIIRFMAECTRASVPYKATAGLHHAIKGRYRLTYEPNSLSAMMFGFLNVFIAGAFLATGMPEDDALLALEERSGDAFLIDDEGISWRGYRLGSNDLTRFRQHNIVSFGSCSFLEPVEELRDLGILWNYPERESP